MNTHESSVIRMCFTCRTPFDEGDHSACQKGEDDQGKAVDTSTAKEKEIPDNQTLASLIREGAIDEAIHTANAVANSSEFARLQDDHLQALVAEHCRRLLDRGQTTDATKLGMAFGLVDRWRQEKPMRWQAAQAFLKETDALPFPKSSIVERKPFWNDLDLERAKQANWLWNEFLGGTRWSTDKEDVAMSKKLQDRIDRLRAELRRHE